MSATISSTLRLRLQSLGARLLMMLGWVVSNWSAPGHRLLLMSSGGVLILLGGLWHRNRRRLLADAPPATKREREILLRCCAVPIVSLMALTLGLIWFSGGQVWLAIAVVVPSGMAALVLVQYRIYGGPGPEPESSEAKESIG